MFVYAKRNSLINKPFILRWWNIIFYIRFISITIQYLNMFVWFAQQHILSLLSPSLFLNFKLNKQIFYCNAIGLNTEWKISCFSNNFLITSQQLRSVQFNHADLTRKLYSEQQHNWPENDTKLLKRLVMKLLISLINDKEWLIQLHNIMTINVPRIKIQDSTRIYTQFIRI